MGQRRKLVRRLIRALRPFADILVPSRAHGDYPLILMPLIPGSKQDRTIRARHVDAARKAIRKARRHR